MDKETLELRQCFKETFFPKKVYDYENFVKRLNTFFDKPVNTRYLRFKRYLMMMANAYKINAGSWDQWNFLIIELKNFCGVLKDPKYIPIKQIEIGTPVKKKNYKKPRKKATKKKFVFLPTGRRRQRFGSGRNTGLARIISGGINQ